MGLSVVMCMGGQGGCSRLTQKGETLAAGQREEAGSGGRVDLQYHVRREKEHLCIR